MKKKYIVKLVLLASIVGLATIPVFAFAQTQFNIATSVPGKYTNVVGTGGPGAFIANFYQFALIIGGILAFGVIVYGGIRYMTSAGNPSGQSDAKEWIEAALLGLLLLAGAYFILAVVNPQLLNLNLPALSGANVSLSGISVPNGGGTGGTTGGSSGNITCKAPPQSGPCSPANLQNTCMGGNAAAAASICSTESSANANSAGDPCSNNSDHASYGLFQINLSVHTIQDPTTKQTLNCPNAFGNTAYTGHNHVCNITDQNLYNQCVAAAKNPATNIAAACAISKSGTSWSQWSSHSACGL